MRSLCFAAAFAALAACSPQPAETPATEEVVAPVTPTELTVMLSRATETGSGDMVGTVTIRPNATAGTDFALDLQGVPAGQHGFHVHETADCSAMADDHGAMTPAGAAGGHWDPQTTGRHTGPEGDGHLGDLPRIEAGADGRVATTVTAPRITDFLQLHNHALMIHAGGDNYTDTPANGGGGARFACGVIS